MKIANVSPLVMCVCVMSIHTHTYIYIYFFVIANAFISAHKKKFPTFSLELAHSLVCISNSITMYKF